MDMVSNKLTFINAQTFLGSNLAPKSWSRFSWELLGQATLERRSVDRRRTRLSMLIGRPMI